MEQRKGRRLILFPLPLQGHMNPMLELANILYFKGFSITIIHTNFNSLNPSTHPHFTYHSISDNLSESEAAEKDLLLLLSHLNTKCFEPFRECLATLVSDVSKEPVACLISDPVFDFTQSVAESLKIPRILLRTGSASFTAVISAFPLLEKKGYIPKQGTILDWRSQ
ncbi:putative cytokinin 7-beta-glucosyltransferase [Rosa chinensis]|uniref:Putative cytokinin 7-beta-glucosyltransferase n=1 Tax=Rosa chinensis TaxID=74649 RepID=A0A2P6SKW0_ROSCH|nr:putative cytokinin 7-beta-glucosyltransferase [Rosa chinensis]